MVTEMYFPKGFLWGAATSAHQVEGGQDNDWSEWEKLGRVNDGAVSGQAGDHWNRFVQDFDLAKELGQNAHRLSLEWSRIEPHPGVWNEDALAHYREVVRALKQRGLEPFVTLWHFSNPRWFAEMGGWESSQGPGLFARYAAKAFQALPEVKFWLTVNEPNVYALLSYLTGYWPPERKNPWRAYRVYRQLAVAHGQAYQTIKKLRPEASVGFAQNIVAFEARQRRSRLDRWAMRTADDWYNHRWIRWLNGAYDFVGINHYLRETVRFGSLIRPIKIEPQGEPQTDFQWQIVPESMYSALLSVARYRRPVFVTENGCADATDRFRKQFIHDYLANVHRAILDGVDVRGYFYWSLLDNFEWREGFSKRFGLVAVDFATQARTVRPSARWYAAVCRANALEI